MAPRGIAAPRRVQLQLFVEWLINDINDLTCVVLDIALFTYLWLVSHVWAGELLRCHALDLLVAVRPDNDALKRDAAAFAAVRIRHSERAWEHFSEQ
jgi:hypothetical protein